MKRILAVLFWLMLMIVPAAAEDRPMLQSPEAQAAWHEDIAFMVERMDNIHPNLFWSVSEAEFQGMVDDLTADIPYLTDDQIKLRLANIASIGGGHTYVWLLQNEIGFHLYPLHLYWFDNGLFVIDAQDESLIGARVVSVGNASAESIYEQVIPFISNDNAMAYPLWSPLYFIMPEVLASLGIIEDVEQPNFVLDQDGEEMVYNPAPLTFDRYVAWNGVLVGLPQDRDVMYLRQHHDENFWFTYLEDAQTVYIQYNAVQGGARTAGSISAFSQQIADVVSQNPVEKVVVDVRHNGGGNNTTYAPFLNLLSRNEAINQLGTLFVITGRQTFSAAMNFVTDMEQRTNALFVGEPTGSRPNHYGDSVPFTLPNSRIVVNVSPQYLEDSTPDDTRPWREPDLPVTLSSNDYFAGRDPVLEAILAYQME